MRNYQKRKLVSFYRLETRRNDEREFVVKVYYKFSKTGISVGKDFDPKNEEIKVKAYVRQLSAEEGYAAKAVQDDSSLEVVINKRKICQDMYMEFKGQDYQIGALDNFTFDEPELKFRATAVIPSAFDFIEYRSF